MARPQHKVALALAGGGPEGAIYEIGAIRALEEALGGVDLNALELYVGVSSGAFIGACLANGLTPAQLCRAVVKSEPGEHPFVPATFFTPAIGEFVRRGAGLPRIVLQAARDYLKKPGDRTLADSLTTLSRALPVGIFANEPIRHYLETIYSIKGRSDDFRKLKRRLVVVAADLETGRAVRFGEPPFDDVPISRAVQASTALPGLYPPVQIAGRNYVDGVLLKTLHASVALDAGAKLVLCINPLVPVDTRRSVDPENLPGGSLLQHGLPSVLSQTLRTLIYSRLEVGLASYAKKYPDADVVLLQPERDDFRMFFTNIFSFSARRKVASHAYQATRRQLYKQRAELGPLLERHGVELRVDVLEDEARDLWKGVGLPEGRNLNSPFAELEIALDALEYRVDHLPAAPLSPRTRRSAPRRRSA